MTLGVSQSASSLARVVGPAFAGIAFEIVGRSGPFLAGAAIMLAALFLARGLPARRAVNTIP